MNKESLPTEWTRGTIKDVVVRDLRKFVDERGWLMELFRHDELAAEHHPTMTYISATEPHVTRGPHEHVDQTDLFCFMGASNFKLRMWDNRKESETYGRVMTLFVGEDNPKSVIVPPGVVHAYRNIGHTKGIVINCPNRLFAGEGKRETVDEIRHEDDPHTVFRIDD
ncbi:MAG: dTDP-4-dehydrorhamnose 3,5-epimerase family protein [Pyrinomonadaceae bacterium MAG19_C2-C3]|nr:dTDP-4-dehydrorhamnose 3,5-epimerase family protein [Pyrinomonadaceae bacterium MAG19_C2-C3]